MGRIANDNLDEETPKNADFDVIQPFQLEVSGLRGRVVKLGPVLNRILSAHNYPLPVAHVLAETAVLALILSSMLKYEGIFTLQTSSDGPVRQIVADVTSAGDLRAYAAFDAEKVAFLEAAALAAQGQCAYQGITLSSLVGKGYLAFTVDQGLSAERYQGIVALEGSVLSDVAQHYFEQSEQIETSLKVAAIQAEGGWQAGGIMLQRMPEAGEHVQENAVVVLHKQDITQTKEDWLRAVLLLQTASLEELANPALHSHDLLYRLFHEEGVRIFDPQPVSRGCRCTPEKLQSVLRSLPEDDVDHAASGPTVDMTCAFCSKTFQFDAKTLEPVS